VDVLVVTAVLLVRSNVATEVSEHCKYGLSNKFPKIYFFSEN